MTDTASSLDEKFLTDVESAVKRLTETWTDVLSPDESPTRTYKPVKHAPLLDMLERAKVSSMGATARGKSDPAERLQMNAAAVSKWNHIDLALRRGYRHFSKRTPPPSLKAKTTGLHGIILAGAASHQVATGDAYRELRQFPRWAEQIWDMFHAPGEVEIQAPCPRCEAVIWNDPEKDSDATALIAYYWRGVRAEARCRVCGDVWDTPLSLLLLGQQIGATPDEDTLREMGVM